jgi:hypothetical protein
LPLVAFRGILPPPLRATAVDCGGEE